ncbi:MAG: hypothetical protein KBC43_00010 [Bacteroidales bacterium]|nr:hypothetical protein [Bacteroidales bacterium]
MKYLKIPSRPGHLRITVPDQFFHSIILILFLMTVCSCASLDSKNYKSRLRAVKKTDDQGILYKVALGDMNREVKVLALSRITDQELLGKYTDEMNDPGLQQLAIGMITDQEILFDIALDHKNGEIKSAAFNKISDMKLVNRLAVEANDPKIQLPAIGKTDSQEVLFKAAMDDGRSEVRQAAFDKLTDPALIGRLAIGSGDTKLQLKAIEKVTDQNTLFEIALKEDYKEAKHAAMIRLTDEQLLGRLANESKDTFFRLMVISKITDQDILYKIALEDENRDAQKTALSRLSPAMLTSLVNDYDERELQLKVIEMLDDQTGLMNISQNHTDWQVRRAAFTKLDDASLDLLSNEATDPAIMLGAKIRRGIISWQEAFSFKKDETGSLGNVIGAAGLVDEPRPSTSDVVSACHNFIRQGDASRIPELIHLLNEFGDKYLAEDYMNCGNGELEDAGVSWGRAHGYNVGSGYGSHRVRWGGR